MRAMVLDRYGDTPHPAELPTPVPGAGQLLVRVRATSVNPIDWKQASGKMRLFIPATFPFVPGYDLAGDVVAVGAGVSDLSVGMRVHTRLSGGGGGASAELVLAGIDVARPVPAGMDYAEAAGMPLAGMTALQGLRDVLGMPMMGARERVLVVGASGGVGHFAVQIAREMGAHVVGVCSGKNAALVKELGAHEVVDYTQADAYAGQAPFDAILDCVGGSPGAFTPRLAPAAASRRACRGRRCSRGPSGTPSPAGASSRCCSSPTRQTSPCSTGSWRGAACASSSTSASTSRTSRSRGRAASRAARWARSC